MDLERVLSQCRGFEARAAAIYRTYAARMRHDAELHALWTNLAEQEETHEQALGHAASWLDRPDAWHTSLDGWDETLHEIEGHLAAAEHPDIGGDVDRQLIAALALERTELDTLYHRLLQLTRPDDAPPEADHVGPLLAVATRRSSNPAVQLEAALLRARTFLRQAS
jgi:rubrerythrin